MKLFSPLFLALFSLALSAKPANLQFYSDGYEAFYSCAYYVVLNLKYSATAYDYSVFCTKPAAIATLAGCYADQGRNNSADTSYWVEQCGTTYLSPITYENITEGYQYLLTDGVALASLGNYTAGHLNVPVIIPTELAIAAKESYEMFIGNYNDSVYYGSGAIAYWGLVCILGGLANWSLIIFPSLRRAVDGKVSRLWRKHVTLPALVRKKKVATQTFWGFVSCIVPSRLESLIVFFFFWLLFILTAVGIHAVKNDTVFSLKAEAINRYVADRTGIMCVTILPLLILFGGRNNFLMWITRWKFATFITFHRWIARFIVLMAFIHGVCFWRTFEIEGDLHEESSETYVVWGIVSAFSGVVICFQGLLVLRRKWYEIFLVLHIILAAFFVIGAWYHIYDLGYIQFMYATIAVWSFDRFVRLVRVLYFGFPNATISLFSDDTIKVEIPKPSRWKAIPGGHAYVYFMHLYHFWQSHPFTYNELDTHVTFFCKVKSGITKSLHNHLSKLPGKSTQMRVGVEGPYGESHPVKQHSDVIFLAGGNGIPGLYSEFEHLNKAADGKQKLKLKWIIREIKSFAWMFKEFQRYQQSNAEITVYVTRPDLVEGTEELVALLSGDVSSSDELKDEKDDKSGSVLAQVEREFPHITFIEGRPEMKDIVESDIGEASHSAAFIACGTAVMVDEVRYQVVSNIDKTEKRIDYYEAIEVWA